MKQDYLFDFVNSIGSSPLFFETIPLPLREEFQSFMFGRTVGKNEKGKYYAFKIDALEWKSSIINHGFQTDVLVKD